MDDTHLALRFAVALGLGILIGLERERAKGEEGGAGGLGALRRRNHLEWRTYDIR